MTTRITKKASQLKNDGGKVTRFIVSETPNRIFRYSMSKSMTEEVFSFSKIHQFDDRHQFKESWDKWMAQDEIKHLFDQEIEQMCEKGYKGDITDKIFKSARYYYRKRESLELQPETQPRKEYLRLSKVFLQAIDTFIENREEIQSNSTIKVPKKESAPANIFNEFCIENQEILRREIVNLIENQSNDESIDIEQKIKKTFKNREYNIRRRIQNTI
jgi:hypothetical protein